MAKGVGGAPARRYALLMHCGRGGAIGGSELLHDAHEPTALRVCVVDDDAREEHAPEAELRIRAQTPLRDFLRVVTEGSVCGDLGIELPAARSDERARGDASRIAEALLRSAESGGGEAFSQ